MRPIFIFGICLLVAVGGCGFGDNGLTGSGACGDHVTGPGEGCDDGNQDNGDGCSADCAVETSNPVCGNGVREVGEPCDDGNLAPGDGCSGTCTVESVCGNNVREQGEACDDGNTAAGDGCSPTCQVETEVDCELVPQSGCAANLACDLAPEQDGSTVCRAISTPGTADSRCSVATACDAGFTCFDDTPAVSYCMRFCNVNADCGTASRCAFELETAGGDPLGARVCSNSCTVLGQTGCPTGTGCMTYDDPAGDFTDCRVHGTKANGTTCTDDLECMAGSLCVTSSGVSRCRSYCNAADIFSCPSPFLCTGFVSPLVIGGTQLGACI